MWLESITRTGKAGGTAALPSVTFEGVQKPNRVDKLGDGLAPFIRLRDVPDHHGDRRRHRNRLPRPGLHRRHPAAHRRSEHHPLLPGEVGLRGGRRPKQDWFNSYVVKRVIEGDNLASSAGHGDRRTPTSAVPSGPRARTSSPRPRTAPTPIARGYDRVQTRKGAATDPRTLTEARYFRGIDGAAVKDSAGVAVTDREQFAGMLRESATYNGDGGALVTATSYTPWRSAPTAARSAPRRSARPGGLPRPARRRRRPAPQSPAAPARPSSPAASTRYGMVSTVSELGDTAKTGDEKCTTTHYARNANAMLAAQHRLPHRDRCRSPAVPRSTAPADVIDDVRTYYDGGAFGAAPDQGPCHQDRPHQRQGRRLRRHHLRPQHLRPDRRPALLRPVRRALWPRPTPTARSPAPPTRPTTGEAPTSNWSTNSAGPHDDHRDGPAAWPAHPGHRRQRQGHHDRL